MNRKNKRKDGSVLGRPRIVDAWIKENEGKHICKCGCNGVIKIRPRQRYFGIPEYLVGHNPNSHPRSPSTLGDNFEIEVIPPHVGEDSCKCGCGGKLSGRKYNNHYKPTYGEYPRFLQGHHKRLKSLKQE